MGRNAGCHSYRNSFRAIYEQIGKFNRKNRGLLLCFVKVGDKVYHVLIQIGKKCFLGHLLQPRLGITHCSRTIPFDISEITMSVHKRHSLFKILAHDHKGVINRTVPVRMILTHGISYDTRTFTVRPVVTYSQFMHIIQDSSLYRFQAIPCIRQGSCDNNTHCIVNIGLLHHFRILCFNDLFFHLLCSYTSSSASVACS